MEHARRGRWAFGLTAGAFAWALAMIPAAFLLPVYGTEAVTNAVSSSSGTTVSVAQHGSATLVAVNGASAQLLIVVALPAVLAMVAWFGLHRVCARGSAPGRRVAAAAICVLAALTFLTGFSIGSEMLPVLVLLVVARSLTPPAIPHSAT